MIALDIPIVSTVTATHIQIIEIINSIEQENLQIRYEILLDDGSVKDRGSVLCDGYDAVKALYVELDVIIATGKTFEVASTELLYSKVLLDLGL